jgi:hypothetical protein
VFVNPVLNQFAVNVQPTNQPLTPDDHLHAASLAALEVANVGPNCRLQDVAADLIEGRRDRIGQYLVGPHKPADAGASVEPEAKAETHR